MDHLLIYGSVVFVPLLRRGSSRHRRSSGLAKGKTLPRSPSNTSILDLRPLNILIGPSGAGKSNFISFFRFMNKLLEKSL